MSEASTFRATLRRELNGFMQRQAEILGDDAFKIDLHCHDRNSDVPDETLGRILGAPETWLPTDKLVHTLRGNGVDALTITNHNNARSCWDLLDRGEDVLPAAEFSCTLPDFAVGVHVLTFGFTPEQESKLVRLRKDIYRFLEYAAAEDLPTVLAHPLQFHSPRGLPSLELMDRFAVLFERFEGLNGQRDAWQNLLTIAWVQSLDEEGVEAAARRTGMRADAFCRRPYAKSITGGSDCHIGVFAGATGTRLHAPGWRTAREKRSELALRALREARMAPYGVPCEEAKLTAALLDYFCQAALRMKDPGLIRLLLHRGSAGEKFLALGIANGVFELRRHKYTSRFLELFHECLQGRRPGLLVSLLTKPHYKPVLEEMDAIAAARNVSAEHLVATLRTSLPAMFHALSALLAERVTGKLRRMEEEGRRPGTPELINKVELPVHFRALFGSEAKAPGGELNGLDLGKWSDGLPFPLLGSLVLGGISFASSNVLFAKRPYFNALAERLGQHRHPRRVLWLTDTLTDKNGVSHVLQSMLAEIRRRDLPIDFLTCGPGSGGNHLLVQKPLSEFSAAFYRDQSIRLPDVLELKKIFEEGGYDRIVCSTEAPMGLLALYLKHAFAVPAYFYVHTDWLDFARRVLKFDTRKQDRLRRILRAFYQLFDGVFLLNSEQRESFASPAMGLSADKLFLTAHWTDAGFQPRTVSKSQIFPEVSEDSPVLLYAGRLSGEKGVLELPQIFRTIREKVPQARLVLAGTGPCEAELKAALPEAVFLGWLDPEKLAQAYSAADLLLLPSWFDTFSCSLLEALSCGLPAVAFRTKGPRDILDQEQGGLLADGPEDMARWAIELLQNPERRKDLAARGRLRAAEYQPDGILSRLLADLGMTGSAHGSTHKSARPKRQRPRSQEPAFIGELLALMNA